MKYKQHRLEPINANPVFGIGLAHCADCDPEGTNLIVHCVTCVQTVENMNRSSGSDSRLSSHLKCLSTCTQSFN